jgi:TolB protein
MNKFALGLFALSLIVTLIGCSSTPPGASDATFDVSPDGKLIVFSTTGTGDSDLYLLNLTTQQVTRITDSSSGESDPSFAPDGKSVIYNASSNPDGKLHLYRMDLASQKITQLTSDEAFGDAMPKFSKDGKQIVFARAEIAQRASAGGNASVWIMNADGTNLHRLSNDTYDGIIGPQITPNGQAVLYAALKGDNFSLFEVDIQGSGAPISLTTDGKSTDPCLSPDGKQIAFISDRIRSFNYDIWCMASNGGQPVQITNKGWYMQNPRFSPDGQQIYFLADDNSSGSTTPLYALYHVDLVTKQIKVIAGSELFLNPIAFEGWLTTDSLRLCLD